MDELSAFAGAPPELREREARAVPARADLVFTGGQSLYEAKKDRHPRVLRLPEQRGRRPLRAGAAAPAGAGRPGGDPAPAPGLLRRARRAAGPGPARAASPTLRPDWQLVIVGPVVEDRPGRPAAAPQHPLPRRQGLRRAAAYLAGWDVALLPFARNESTRFISPTKTPEYLAAGKPVVSTSIRDVVRPYGDQGLVRIADTPEEFVAACEAALARGPQRAHGARRTPSWPSMSWDKTWDADGAT